MYIVLGNYYLWGDLLERVLFQSQISKSLQRVFGVFFCGWFCSTFGPNQAQFERFSASLAWFAHLSQPYQCFFSVDGLNFLDLVLILIFDLVLILDIFSVLDSWFCFPVRHFSFGVFGVGSLSVHRLWPVSKSDMTGGPNNVRFWPVWRGSATHFSGSFFWVCFGLFAVLRACWPFGDSIYS